MRQTEKAFTLCPAFSAASRKTETIFAVSPWGRGLPFSTRMFILLPPSKA